MKEIGSYLLDVLFMGGLITASLCDFKKRKIPDAITGFLFLTGFAVWDSLAFGMALAGGYCLCLMLLRNGREQKIALGPFLSMGLMFGMFRSMGA